jgi:hypothetical protein
MVDAFLSAHARARLRAIAMTTSDAELQPDRGASVAGRIGRFSWQAIRLPLLAITKIVEPLARIVLSTVALLGILVSLVLEFSSAAPRFPFWLVLGMSLGCGVLVFVLGAVKRRLAQ